MLLLQKISGRYKANGNAYNSATSAYARACTRICTYANVHVHEFSFILPVEIYLSIHDCVLDGAIMYGCNYNTHAVSFIL